MPDKEVTRAGFGPRAAALLIDGAVLLIALGAVKTPFAIAALIGADTLTAGRFIFDHSVVDVVCWLLASAYFVTLTWFTGGTLGKKVMRLRVEKDGGELRLIDVIYRETVGRFLSGILCIGYLMAIVDKNKRAFHDYLCDTRVVYAETVFRAAERAARPADGAVGDGVLPAVPALGYSVPGRASAGDTPVPAETETPDPTDDGAPAEEA